MMCRSYPRACDRRLARSPCGVTIDDRRGAGDVSSGGRARRVAAALVTYSAPTATGNAFPASMMNVRRSMGSPS